MSIRIKTYLLKGFDIEQTRRSEQILNYLSQKNDIENQVSIIEKLDLELAPDEFLILFIDELTANQIGQDKSNYQFFTQQKFRNNQVLIILDDISSNDLPVYLHMFPVFAYTNRNEIQTDDNLEWETNDPDESGWVDVYNDIIQFIKRVKAPQKRDSLTVYIGPFDDNTTYEYQKLTRELLYRQYNIIPEISNPTAKELLENKEHLKSMLENADLAIHFIGHKSLQDYPESLSAALKINQITADFCNSESGMHLNRIIYVPAETSDTPEILEQKINLFKSDIRGLTNAELIQTPIEKFKEIVLEKIKELSLPVSQRNKKLNADSDIYFIYPPGFDSEVKDYLTWFDNKKLNYSTSQVDLDQLELLQYHQNNLANCNKVFIYNSGNSQWFNRKISDIIKAPGWGRNKKFDFIAICGNPIDKGTIQLLNNQKTIEIHDNGKFDEKKLAKIFS